MVGNGNTAVRLLSNYLHESNSICFENPHKLVIHSISSEIESFNKFVLSCVSTSVQKMLDLSPWLTMINKNGHNF